MSFTPKYCNYEFFFQSGRFEHSGGSGGGISLYISML
ncbi:MAG: hypothetical protein FD170_232 [Bacteroidetes bacterium]|nr:MAG: hypothetical protein FD170_232 [Bacteroidota bacterium]